MGNYQPLGGKKMYSRGTKEEQQRYNRGPTLNGEYIILKGFHGVTKLPTVKYVKVKFM